MYIPSAFSETDVQTLLAFIKRYPLGLLISFGQSGLLASPIPFLYRENNGRPMLVSHLARANPHWKDLLDLKECLVVFQGIDGYVTPSWYPSKQTTHKVVPTWNYEMVQIKGVPKVVESTDWLRCLVGDLTDSMEATRKSPWRVDDAPPDFIDSQLRAIVGLEIDITVIQGKWKMSQNRPTDDAKGVVRGLSDPHDPHANLALAQIVSKKNKL
ncbi:FMN-binding negative transcriptional regulator [Polynucleobacter sp. es-EL-1]|uniref:FMN-binding negative transcriptional regulator n=1 Tax=Polynucleobacter sp. es-EL-1 TaxID=1855652 RepID=UPI001BFE7EAD|nr:FMN-binding negative transcriptional regulator [Polynucleobacter sp. es-EL-1]QWE10512.1 FMN-binding negative transcriptional regulator [Polynucleobacter sp. es-EL-1]